MRFEDKGRSGASLEFFWKDIEKGVSIDLTLSGFVVGEIREKWLWVGCNSLNYYCVGNSYCYI